MPKKCTYCKKQKPLFEFALNKKRKSGLASFCRVCKRAYERKYYSTSKRRQNSIKKNKAISRQKTREFVYEYLKTHPCVDCGENDPIVLEFDHVRGKKRGDIAALKQISQRAVEQEIKKCEVRCANCHRRKTAKQFKWTRKLPA
jgi:hypothetical protein